MGKPNPLVLIPITAAVLAFAGGCASAPKALPAPDSPMMSAEAEGIGVTLRFRDDGSLKRQFGAEENPFLSRYSLLFFRRIVVFELEARNESSQPVELELKRCELSIEGKKAAAVSRNELSSYWQVQEGEFYPQRVRRKELIINRYVLETRKRIQQGAVLQGYLVFQGDLPDRGEARVSLGLYRGGQRIPLELAFVF